MARGGDPEEVLETEGGRFTVGELQRRCKLLEPGIVHIRHPSHGSADTFNLLVDTAVALAAPFKQLAIVNDLTESKQRPRGAYQEAIIKRCNTDGLHWANVWPSNAFTRVVAQFILARLMRRGSKSTIVWTFHDNVDAALAAARATLAKASSPHP
jgi:hypothetical protein